MIYCLKHSAYRGITPPVLACKTCCHIFISEIKRRRDAGEAMPSFMEKDGSATFHGPAARAHLKLSQVSAEASKLEAAKKRPTKPLSSGASGR